MSSRVAVITGANRGLGFAAARELAKQGYKVVVTARTQSKAAAAATELGTHGDVLCAELDVSSDDSVRHCFQRLLADVGSVSVLVNNAGAIFDKDPGGRTYPALQIPSQNVADSFNTNSLSVLRTCQQVLPGMNKQRFGRIVNVSSGMGGLTDMSGGHLGYRVSKAAMNALTRVLHAEAGENVKINAVCPGWVRTDMGGANATRDLEAGVSGIVWAATLPDDGPSGGFFRDGKPIRW